MTHVFQFSRFGKYFVYELNRLRNNFGVSLLAMGILPLIVYVFSGILKMFSGSFSPVVMGQEGRISLYCFATLFLVIAFPSKVWGNLTEKHAGSEYLMIPASRLEKFLSMMLVALVVVPLVFNVLYLSSDALLCALFKDCGEPLVYLPSKLNALLAEDGTLRLVGGGFWIGYMVLVGNILLYLLGALFFKKAKPAKTILCMFLLSILGALIIRLVAGPEFMSLENDVRMRDYIMKHPEFSVNLLLHLSLTLPAVVLAVLTWFRLKYLKH